MTREQLYKLIEKRPVIMDGATGSNLQKAGMPAGVCPEQWILEHKDVLIGLQKAYVDAGTDIVLAPTFSGNRIKLAEYGLEDQMKDMHQNLVALSREAVGQKGFVGGDMTMTGQSLAPIGTLTLEELIDIYKEQATCLYEAGVDLFVVETMMSLAETRAAVLAIKEVCDLPVIASMTYQEDGRTLYGTDPVTAVTVLQSIGADVIGINCSTGPAEMMSMVKEMYEVARVPLMVKPNAGLPILVRDETVYPMGPEEFASYGKPFLEAGASLIGGCCGTTPEHIRLLKEEVQGLTPKPPVTDPPVLLASERKSQRIEIDGRFLVIGERINPTGKKKLQAALREGDLTIVEDFAQQQEEMGADILDINMGTSGIDEKEMMLKAIDQVTMVSSLPLSIDTSYVDVMEAALLHYPGRALINSISLETEKIEKLLPLVKKYGAMFILLPLSDAGIPKDLDEKKQIIHEILEKSDALGISRDQIIVDGLVATVGANKNAAIETLETIRYCKEELGLCTVMGLSNISFGLPERSYVNGAFAAMAIREGLTMAIANPSNNLLMGSALAADLLMNKPESDITYIHQVQKMGPAVTTAASGGSAGKETAAGSATQGDKNGQHRQGGEDVGTKSSSAAGHAPVYEAVLKGNQKGITALVQEEIDRGTPPKKILDDMLIEGITEVGRLFDRQIYFLPQLISSANAMKEAISYLEPLLKEDDSGEDRTVIVIATVEGDVHDIGKNLVALMLRNYGYNVIDLGKDVPAETIIREAKKHRAKVIALSALMTTTMVRMKDTIHLRDEEALDIKVIIGGAATTPGYAEEIHADGYSRDAAEAVTLVQNLLKEDSEQ